MIWSCAACGPSRTSRANWCDWGCGSDCNQMTQITLGEAFDVLAAKYIEQFLNTEQFLIWYRRGNEIARLRQEFDAMLGARFCTTCHGYLMVTNGEPEACKTCATLSALQDWCEANCMNSHGDISDAALDVRHILEGRMT